jgi:UDP-N-acetylglucosamine--N-acetylmuramyl-(pentapeptide) pyrophosphoryl-undecaprenol N-acetylglucosamine transferase
LRVACWKLFRKPFAARSRSATRCAPPAQRQHHDGPARVLVVGGSQGARALNERMPAALALMPVAQRPQVRHQAGRTLDVAQRAYATAGIDGDVEAFITDMVSAYAWADLVVCRAGASTVAEVSAAGCATLLVPFPHAVDDHQTRNAQHLVRAGAALLVQESELTPERLAVMMGALLGDRARLLRMAECARSVAWTNSTNRIADETLAAAGKR